MEKKIEIAQVDRMNSDILVVAFSDGTSREYKAALLHALPEDDAASTEPEGGTEIRPEA